MNRTHIGRETLDELNKTDTVIERIAKKRIIFIDNALKSAISKGFTGIIITENEENFKTTIFAAPTHDHEGIVTVTR